MEEQVKSHREMFDELVKNIPAIGDTLVAPEWDTGCINVCSTDRVVAVRAEGIAHVNIKLDEDKKLRAWVNAKILPYRKNFKWFLSGDYHQGLRCYLSSKAITKLLELSHRLDLLHVSRVMVIDQVEREGSKYLVVDLA